MSEAFPAASRTGAQLPASGAWRGSRGSSVALPACSLILIATAYPYLSCWPAAVLHGRPPHAAAHRHVGGHHLHVLPGGWFGSVWVVPGLDLLRTHEAFAPCSRATGVQAHMPVHSYTPGGVAHRVHGLAVPPRRTWFCASAVPPPHGPRHELPRSNIKRIAPHWTPRPLPYPCPNTASRLLPHAVRHRHPQGVTSFVFPKPLLLAAHVALGLGLAAGLGAVTTQLHLGLQDRWAEGGGMTRY